MQASESAPPEADGASSAAAADASGGGAAAPKLHKRQKLLQRVAVGNHLEHQRLGMVPDEGKLRAARKEDFKKFRCGMLCSGTQGLKASVSFETSCRRGHFG